MLQNTRNIFFEILRSGVRDGVFRSQVTELVDRDRLFIPGYLELIWFSEMVGDSVLYNEFLAFTKKITKHIYANKETQKIINDTWTEFELDSLRELFELHYKHETSAFGKLFVLAQQHNIDRLFSLKTKTFQHTNTFLKCFTTVDPKPLQKEVEEPAPFWWNYNNARSVTISNHRHTHAIVLRSLNGYTKQYGVYKAIDGVHESKPESCVSCFPEIHSTVLDFAKENKLGLGRVCLVRLQPWQQAYRHYDFELHLKGRKRYHLVIQAGEKNILSSGSETVTAKPGEIWYFDNKVMHRAHNKSDTERIHVIFDGYPLGDN